MSLIRGHFSKDLGFALFILHFGGEKIKPKQIIFPCILWETNIDSAENIQKWQYQNKCLTNGSVYTWADPQQTGLPSA